MQFRESWWVGMLPLGRSNAIRPKCSTCPSQKGRSQKIKVWMYTRALNTNLWRF